MSLSNNFPTIFPELNLDFANTGVLDPRITFTRASTATYYNGVTTAKAEENLLLQSQDFTAAAWVNTNSTDSANSETAPDGTVTADTITDDATSGPHSVYQTITTALDIDYAFSCFLKAGTATYGFISLFDFINPNRFATVVVDLSGGTITDTENAAGTTATSSITSVGNGWYRVVVVAKRSSGAFAHVRIGLSDSGTPSYNSFGSPTYSGTSSTIYAWGAQLEQRSAVTAYTPTTTSPITNYIPVLQTAAVDVPRFDYNPITEVALGLLIEEARTNLQINSEDFTSVDWSKGSNTTITANSVISPAGTLTADTFGYTAITSGILQVADNQTKAASAITYTGSVYVKATSGLYFHFYVDANGTTNSGRVIIDTSNWSVFSSTNFGTFTGTSGTVTPVGNNWYRITCTTTSGTETNIRFNLYWSTLNNTVTFTPAGTEAVYIWGAQLEAGAFATSYIPTTTTALTRSADSASMTGTNFSSWYNAAEGTLVGESSSSRDTANRWPFAFDDGSASNLIGVRFTSTQVQQRVFVSSSAQADIVESFSSGTAKTALAYKANDFAASLNGGTVGTDTSGTVPTVTQFTIGAVSGGTRICGTIRRIAYYSVRLTNAQLQALTL